MQSGYHLGSLCLYTKLGFAVREHLANFQGPPIGINIPGCMVRPATGADVATCDLLCRAVHGHERGRDLRDAVDQGAASVVDLKALIAAAPSFAGPGFLLPSRNTELFQWCLAHGLRMVQATTLMTIGLYNEPRGAHLPSVLF